ncbi:MAG: hypothetical protein AAGJ10_07815 [Bacteroidota bacterium]
MRARLSFWMIIVLLAAAVPPVYAQADHASEPASLADLSWSELDAFYAQHAQRLTTDAADSLLTWRAEPNGASAEAGVRWLLTPGRVQLVAGHAAPDTVLATSVHMTADFGEAAHRALWEAVDGFRTAHPALAMGGHEVVSAEAPYIFHRRWKRANEQDDVVVALGASGRTMLNVSKAFADNAILRNAITGEVAFVGYGSVYFTPDETGILLVEEVK